MGHVVALVVHEDAMLYETAIAAEVFGPDRSDLSVTGDWYDLRACTRDGAPSPWLPGYPSMAYAQLPGADTVVVSSVADTGAQPDPALLAALREARDRGARVAALCTGAFVLAAAGLLDGAEAATHWMHASALAAARPQVTVRPDVLYVDGGQVLTSAGKTAALDLCLHMVHRDYGAAAANALARRLVVASHRPGGQAQFITPPPDPSVGDRLGEALDWARAHLDEPLTVADLARRAGVSPRQLARRMAAQLSQTPLDWLHRQRILRAQDLLERTEASVEQVAQRCGMGTATTLRRNFQRATGVTPTAYRAAFRGGPAG